MKRILTISALTLIVSGATGAPLANDDASFYLRLARSLESFGAVFREVNTTFVDEVDPQDLVEVGIDAMLKHLDPYSTYMKVDETDDIDMLSTGSYVGFGISVGRRDSNLTIIDIRDNGPAKKAGIRIGDRLMSIDAVRTDTMSPQGLRPITKGLAGSIAHLRVMRGDRLDTLDFVVTRSDLPVETVGHVELLPGQIGYVHLARFARGTGLAVRKALSELQDQANLKGFILDLRDNPGGLLDAAVDVVELFVPRSSLIVSTKGRDGGDHRSYISNEDPIEPTLPLAVLINERSASASEIVAGAIQDLDRGVILGKRSYGKGLVQTMVSLPNDASLKLTTSRYYTPSGRCIQRIDYRTRRAPVVDPNGGISGVDSVHRVFRTTTGRTVWELHGIDPDSAVSDSTLPAALAYLDQENVFGQFATLYTANLDRLPDTFIVDKGLIDRFVQYVDGLPESKRSPFLADLAMARKKALASGWSTASLKSLEQAERSLDREIGKAILQNQSLVTERLEQEIRSRFATDEVRQTRALKYDPMVKTAKAILTSPQYRVILAVQVPSDQ
ncbi:MAG: S41 family peptidase [Candidatus Kapabacteria bacterium]|nr:S41 family peptidase [Candidatus Kapabacteria bacterium]